MRDRSNTPLRAVGALVPRRSVFLKIGSTVGDPTLAYNSAVASVAVDALSDRGWLDAAPLPGPYVQIAEDGLVEAERLARTCSPAVGAIRPAP